MKKILSTVAAFLIATLLASSGIANAALSEQEAKEIGVNAYLYFYPLVTMDATRKQMTNTEAGKKPGYGPMNEFSHVREYPTADMKVVVRPNFDTLYSIAWLDIVKEPIILSVPNTDGRYYLMPILDMWTDAFAVPGKRTTGTEAGDYAIVPQGWKGKLPKGVQRIDAPTPYAWVVGRTQTNGPDDYAAVHKVQDGYKLTPLSQWGKKPKPVKAVIDATVDMKTPPMEQVHQLSAAAYFKYATELMKVNPPHITDWSMVAQLKKIGIEQGKSFDYDKLDPAVKQALDKAPADSLALMKWKLPTLARIANGWSMNTDTMGTYGDYYLKRAMVSMLGLGANQPADAIYPMNIADADGKPMMGEQKYVLHFNKEELPPVEAFWSVTMYDEAGYQTPNPINRFAVSSWMPFKYNADGSLDLYIQHDSPDADKVANWLPSPAAGKLGVTMRLYAPNTDALDGRWNPPAVKRVQ
jgi:hypothetical protein